MKNLFIVTVICASMIPLSAIAEPVKIETINYGEAGLSPDATDGNNSNRELLPFYSRYRRSRLYNTSITNPHLGNDNYWRYNSPYLPPVEEEVGEE